MEFEPLDQYLQRQKKLSEIEALGHAAYPHKFAWTHTPKEVAEKFGERTAEELTAEKVDVRVAGRIVALRPHGKAAFAHIAGDGARLQIYVRLDVVGEAAFKLFQLLDLGDIIGVAGELFRTKTNELTVRVVQLELLTQGAAAITGEMAWASGCGAALPAAVPGFDWEREDARDFFEASADYARAEEFL